MRTDQFSQSSMRSIHGKLTEIPGRSQYVYQEQLNIKLGGNASCFFREQINQLILKGLWFFLQMVYWTFNRSQRQSLPLLVFFQSGLKVIPSPLHLNGAIPCDDFDTRYPECWIKRQGNSHKFNKKSCMTKTIVKSRNEAKEKKASLW